MKNLLQRLLRWIRAHSRPDKVMYIGGSDTLPQPLPRAEEAALIARLADSDPAARQTLIERNLRLVVYIARRFENTGINIEDLISIGTIGLIKAINTFRADKNIKLATYASRCIENEILMYLRKNSSQRTEVSLDEPLNTDWDGKELLLSDVLGTEGDVVHAPHRGGCRPQAPARRGGEALWARTGDHHHALRSRRAQGADAEGGGRPARYLPVVYLAA